MDEKKAIKKYISDVRPGILVVGLLLLLGTLACVALALRARAAELPEPVYFDALEGENNSYVYLDVIGVSDWVYTYDTTTYYVLADTTHRIYVGSLPDEQFEAMRHQNDYWNGLNDEEIPVRVTGITLRLTDTMKSSFMEVFELSDGEFDDYFGYHSFSAGTNPREENAAMWSVIAVLLAFFSLFCLIGGGAHLFAVNKAITRLEKSGQLSQAAAELNSPLAESVNKDRLRLTSRFLFGRRAGLAAPWEDVLWCYERVVKLYGVVGEHRLIICTSDGKTHSIGFGSKEDELQRVMADLKARNPEMLIGFSRENRKAWREQCR